MAITSLDSYLASTKQLINYTKTGILTSVAAGFHSMWSPVGYPFNTTWSAGNTANGVVPTSADTGYPRIRTITNTGYLSRVLAWGNQALATTIYDDVFKAGAFAFNANVTLAAQPSYAARIPGGDYRGTEIWIEAATAFTGNLSINVTYTNQDGVTGRTNGVYATAIAPILGRMIRIPLQAGDSGVQKIESVVATVATAGTFNVHVLRPLYKIDTGAAYVGIKANLFETGMPIVYTDTALFFVNGCSTTSTPVIHCYLEIADG